MSQDNSVVEDIRPDSQVMTNGGSNQTLDEWVIEALDGLADDTNDLPISLIATNLDARIFTDPSFKVSTLEYSNNQPLTCLNKLAPNDRLSLNPSFVSSTLVKLRSSILKALKEPELIFRTLNQRPSLVFIATVVNLVIHSLTATTFIT